MIINAQILRATNGCEGCPMRRNEAHNLIPHDQIAENPKPMEARLTRIESDVAELRKDMKTANEAIAEVKGAVKALDAKFEGQFTALRAEIRATSSSLESRLIKWMIGTLIASMGTAMACAGLVLAVGKLIFVTKVP